MRHFIWVITVCKILVQGFPVYTGLTLTLFVIEQGMIPTWRRLWQPPTSYPPTPLNRVRTTRTLRDSSVQGEVKIELNLVIRYWLYQLAFIRSFLKHIWAATCDFQQCRILTSVDSDEPVQSPFKLRNSKWCSVSSLTLIEYSND